MSDAQPKALTCPNCGAPAAAGAARCEYCHSTLAAASCPFCFKVVFQGSAFCPYCGTALKRAEAVDERTTPCPACRGAMRWVKVGDTDLLECSACDGTWLEAAAFEQLCANRESQGAVLHREGAEPTAATKSAEGVHYRPCPRCGKLMNRINFGRLSGTVVDVCRGHGTFLDRGELHQVVQFILNGGLDRTRQHERDELVEQQRRLQSLERDQAGTSPSGQASVWTSNTLQQLIAALTSR